MRYFPLIVFLVTWITVSLTVDASEYSGKKIILIEKSKQLTQREIRKTARSESEKNADGGYNANPGVTDCLAVMEYRSYTGGRYIDEPIRFRMLFPEKIIPGKKYPLVIWFHGKGESGEDNTRQLSHVQSTLPYLTGKEKLEFFIIATQCPGDNPLWETSISDVGRGDAPMTIVHEIFEAALEEYPIDPARLEVFGLCSGGNAAWSFVGQHPGRFASMVTCSATPPPGVNPQNYVGTRIWAFNNIGDTAPYQVAERMVRAINGAGGNAHLVLNDTDNHDSWTKALRKDKVIGWMILQHLDNGGPPQGVRTYHRSAWHLLVLFGLPLCIMGGILIKRSFNMTLNHNRESA